MTEQTMDDGNEGQRKGVRRTVTILVAIVVAFFLLSFVQIAMMK